MACCGGKKHAGLEGRSSNRPTRIIERIKRVRSGFSLQLEVVGTLFEKFQTFSTIKHGREVCEKPQFKDMIGILGNFYIGERIFGVVL